MSATITNVPDASVVVLTVCVKMWAGEDEGPHIKVKGGLQDSLEDVRSYVLFCSFEHKWGCGRS